MFFKDPKAGVISEKKVDEFNEVLKQKYSSLTKDWFRKMNATRFAMMPGAAI